MENLVQNAYEVGGFLRDGLLSLQEKYPAMGDVRGMGLMQAVEFVGENKSPDAGIVKELFEEMKKEKVLIGKGGLYGNVVRISPPLNITKTEVSDFLRCLDVSLGRII